MWRAAVKGLPCATGSRPNSRRFFFPRLAAAATRAKHPLATELELSQVGVCLNLRLLQLRKKLKNEENCVTRGCRNWKKWENIIASTCGCRNSKKN